VLAQPAAFLEKAWARSAGAERVAAFAEVLQQGGGAQRLTATAIAMTRAAPQR
jgi:hypothetical protein